MSSSGKAKIALITGGNKGLGLETARQLGGRGVTVLVGARDLDKGEQAAEKLRSMGVDARAIKLDVLNEADIQQAADTIAKDYGRLDILINNAGVNYETLGENTTLNVSEQDLRKTFDTNFFAVVNVTRAMLPLLEKSASGRIVNLSSILGSLTLHSKPGGLGTMGLAYDSSKTALNAFTIHLAAAVKGTGIKVNAAHPGWVKTDMGTSAAPLEIEDGAKTQVQLALLPDDGPTGGFFHLGETIPW